MWMYEVVADDFDAVHEAVHVEAARVENPQAIDCYAFALEGWTFPNAHMTSTRLSRE